VSTRLLCYILVLFLSFFYQELNSKFFFFGGGPSTFNFLFDFSFSRRQQRGFGAQKLPFSAIFVTASEQSKINLLHLFFSSFLCITLVVTGKTRRARVLRKQDP